MLFISRVLAIFVLSAAIATGQKAGYRFYGAACQDQTLNVPVVFEVRGVPKLGSSVTIITVGRYTNRVVSQTSYITLGFSNTRLGSFRLPLDLAVIPVQPRNCGWLYHSTEIILHGGSRFTYSVPNDARLLGAKFHQQVLELRCNSQQRVCYWATSNAAEVTIGSF